MERKKESQEFASIDENPVASKSIDTNLARANLQRLQDHVNQQFSNVSSSPCAARVIGSETWQHQQMSYLSRSGLDLIQKPPSIKDDDDLFRGESDSNHSGDNAPNTETNLTRKDIIENENVESTPTDVTGIERTESGFESSEAAFCATIPNFEEIGLSFTSKSSNGSDADVNHPSAENKDLPGGNSEFGVNEGATGNDKVKTEDVGEESVGRSVEFRVHDRCIYRRSQSDIKEKRKRFSQRDDFTIEEIPVFDEDSQVPVRKSNSLPDLILSLSSSNSSPRSGSDKQSPDVVFRRHQDDSLTDNQRDRKTLKDSFEGKSSFEKPDTGDFDHTKRKPSFTRSVSFNYKTHCRYFDKGEPAVSPGVFNESVENPLHDTTHSVSRMLHQNDDKHPDQIDENDDLQRPKSVEGRRQLFSKSSGYQTGSDQSRESHDTQNESFDKTDMEKEGSASHTHLFAVNEVKDVSKTDSGTIKSDTSTSSNETILEQIISESERQQEDFRSASSGEQTEQSNEISTIPDPSPELPFLSIMQKSPESSLGNYIVEKKSLENDNENNTGNTASGTTAENAQISGQPLQEHLMMKAMEFRRSQSTLGPSMPGSMGNLPKLEILDDKSYLLGPSTLEKVHDVDNQQEERVRRKYVEGSGTLAGGNSPSTLDEAVVANRHSLSSYQMQVPKSLMVQEFEQILIANEPEKVTAAVHKLLESSSSSPGHSPFEYGEGRNSASSPRNKLFTVEDLERASRCTDTTCTEKDCEKMRQVYMLLKLDIEESHSMTNLMLTQYLEALYQHSANCEEIMCSVLYCHKCDGWCNRGFDPHYLLAEIRAHIKNPLGYLEQQTQPRFIKLHSNVSDEVPNQFITYIPLSFLHESEKLLLIQDLQQQRLCVLKQYPLFEDNHQMRTLETLRNLDHPHLITQLWMLEFADENVLQISSRFMQGGSLQEYLCLAGKLPWLQAANYLKQLTDAVCFLQERRVVYLNWQSDNMLFPDTRRETIKLSDFGLSHCLDGQADIGALKQCLPVYLCPPELLKDNTVCEKSDCWGLACLLVEMLTGTPLWYDLRHEDRETVQKKISSNMIPHVENPSTNQEIIYKNCWLLNPDQRCTIEKLDKFLDKVLSGR